MTLTYMSYADQQAVMDGRMSLEEAQRRAAGRAVGGCEACGSVEVVEQAGAGRCCGGCGTPARESRRSHGVIRFTGTMT